MPQQIIKGYDQINTGTVQRDNLDISTANKSVIRRIISGTNVTIDQTGADIGTGDVYLNVIAVPRNGWIPSPAAMTFLSSDAPSFVLRVVGNVTGTFNDGMKFKITQSGQDKFFFVTKVSITGSNSYINLYGGTDFTLISGALPDIYYSIVKSPFGFPTNPEKWTVTSTDSSLRTQANPSGTVWYNLGSMQINVPIGVWRTIYTVLPSADRAANGLLNMFVTLSTSSNTESDASMTRKMSTQNTTLIEQSQDAERILVVNTKTPYFLLTKQQTGGAISNIYNDGSKQVTTILLICAYL